jgi:spermidine synthase
MTWFALFILSGAILGLELVLVRALAIGHWHHFSYLVISTALLGFGAGGTLITLFSRALTKNTYKTAWLLAAGMAVTIPIVFHASQDVPLDELQLIWDGRQVFYLLAYYLLYFIPFFFGAGAIAVVFTSFGRLAHRLYFWNMAGSGLGAAAIVALMYGNSPTALLLIISSAGFLASALFACKFSRSAFALTVVLGTIWVMVFSPAGPWPLELKISENKSLVYYRNLPDARTLAVRYSPLARIDCIDAPGIRSFAGLSIAYTGALPEQMVIISDADAVSAVNRFKSVSELDCFVHTTTALAYYLLESPPSGVLRTNAKKPSGEPLTGPRVCVIGSGGGSDVAQALAFGAGSITAVEVNHQIIELLNNELSEFSNGIYQRDDVNVVIAEGRSFLQTTQRRFDLINISLLESFSASAAGLYSLNESHLYTIESVEKCLERLNEGGMLSITRSIKMPPRDSLKMLATVTEALLRRKVTNPAEHIIMIRGYSTATIVVCPQPFSDAQVKMVYAFTSENSFDLVNVPGIEPSQANRFDVLDEPYYYDAAQAILSNSRKTFYDSYDYYIKPATDDRPYFFDFFKFRSLPRMIRTLGRRWLVFSEWGYIVLFANLVQAVITSAILILLPVWICKGLKGASANKLAVLSYFLLLGFSYMFIEMAFIQKMTLFIGRAVLGVAVTLLSFLLFSGCGSLAAERCYSLFSRKSLLVKTAVAAIALATLANILLFRGAFDFLVGLSQPLRILLGIAVIAPPAFFMGIPFPTALRCVHSRAEVLTAWGWAANGFASVIGAVLGTLLAVSTGFTAVAIIAVGLYITAGGISPKVVG